MKRRRQVLPSDQQAQQTTGSSQSGEPVVYIAVGRLRRTHGLQGEIVMQILTDFPERIRPGKTIYVGDQHLPMRLDGVRMHGAGELIVRIVGYGTPEEVVRLRNEMIYVTADTLPKLPDGQYYHHQLLGLAVVDPAGQPLGELAEILETGANDVYLVRKPDGGELLLPVIDSVILSVDLTQGVMHVSPPEWLS